MKQGKVWGNTQLIFKNNNFEIHRIEIKNNSFCSKHKHDFKYNMFFVESGILKIKVWKNDYNLCDETIINKGENTTVKPREFHLFESLSDVIAYEIYYTEGISEDIIRENVGGIKN